MIEFSETEKALIEVEDARRRLLAALEPFAKIADKVLSPDYAYGPISIRLPDLATARDVFASKGGPL